MWTFAVWSAAVWDLLNFATVDLPASILRHDRLEPQLFQTSVADLLHERRNRKLGRAFVKEIVYRDGAP